MNTLRFLTLAIAVSFFAIACNTPRPPTPRPAAEPKAEPPAAEPKAATPEAPKAAQALYRCPMHTDQTSTDPKATCPVCGMVMEPISGK